MNGIELIAQERVKQLITPGKSILDDVEYNSLNQLTQAASMLCLSYDDLNCIDIEELDDHTPPGWDRDKFMDFMRRPHKERIIIAGALLAAELDRLIYLEKNEQDTTKDC